MKRLAVLLSLAFVLGVTPSASAHHYIGYHWKRNANPFTVNVTTSLQNAFTSPVAAAAAEWSSGSAVLDFALAPGSTTAAARRRCAYIRGAVHLCSGDYGRTSWVGLTQFSVNGHHIIAVRIRLNTHLIPANFRRTVSCHELGHSIGLAHRAQSSSCMKQGRTRAHPDAHDYGELNKIYSHLDGMTPERASSTTSYSIP